MDIYVGILLIGLALAVLFIRSRTQGMNVPRAFKRRTKEVLYYDEMTDEQRRENGFIPMKDLPPDWQDFYRRKPKP